MYVLQVRRIDIDVDYEMYVYASKQLAEKKEDRLWKNKKVWHTEIFKIKNMKDWNFVKGE